MTSLYVYLEPNPLMYENKPNEWTLKTRTICIEKRLRMSAFYRFNKNLQNSVAKFDSSSYLCLLKGSKNKTIKLQ